MNTNVFYENTCLIESMTCYIGKTVTIFTISGGASGCGFTGVLAAVTPTCVKLITDIGAPPACPIGSSCCNNCRCKNYNCRGKQNLYNTNWLGSITDIPICAIACFTHHSI